MTLGSAKEDEPRPAMPAGAVVHHLSQLLRLEKVATNRWRSGWLGDPGWGTVFGGQLLAQAVMAAHGESLNARSIHSLHASFLRAGRPLEPIDFEVVTLRDGRAYCTRRVTALQGEASTLEMVASFHAREPGETYQRSAPPDFDRVPPPESLPPHTEFLAGTPLIDVAPTWFSTRRGVDMRYVNSSLTPSGPSTDEGIRYWVRADEGWLDDHDAAAHAATLAYVSDEALSDCLLVPFGRTWAPGETMVLSLDHSMWFHRPPDMNRWHFIEQRPVAVHGARGFSMAHAWSQGGELIVTFAQEALFRIR